MLRLFPCALCLSASLLALAACSGRTVSVGAVNGDAGDSGGDSKCTFPGVDPSSPDAIHHVGDTFPSPDGCNHCGCQASGIIICTERACAPVDGGGGCTVNGVHHAAGEPFTLDCNTCSCDETGLMSCTANACEFTCPPDGTIDCQPVVDPKNATKCSGAYHDFIVASCPGVSFSF